MTTKLDLLRDILTDALIDLDFNFDHTDDGDGEVGAEIIRDGLVDDIIASLEDYDQNATNQDFKVKVVMDKPEMFPGTLDQLNNLSIRK